MAKPKEKQKVKKAGIRKEEIRSVLFPFLSSFRAQAAFLLIIGFIFYANSLRNQYALDDDIVILKNKYVQDGFRGIKKIMSRDAYDSFYSQMQSGEQLSGGRYRPLSIVTFAIEKQFFGNDAGVRHFFNVAFYLLSVVVLLYLLRYYFFRSLPDIAFIAALLFTVHPIHTEVVANVKSRDEIFSFLFICLTFIYAFRWREDNKTGSMLKAAACYFLALLSKEWGITLVALIPLAFVIFRKEGLGESIKKSIPFFAVAVVYMMLRIKFVGLGGGQGHDELLNNPYLLATKAEKWATQIFVLLKYLGLLIVPYPLSADYSYNTIHYRSFGSWDTWLSLAVYAGMAFMAWKFYKQRHPLAFAILLYLAFLSMVSNFILNIGASMGERLVYHSSLGFVMMLAIGLHAGLNKLGSENARRAVLYALLVPVIALFGWITVERNAQWKNDRTLFIHDAKVVNESVMANGNAGKSFIEIAESVMKSDSLIADFDFAHLRTGIPQQDSVLKQQLLDSALFYLNRATALHPRHYIAYLNMGFVWYIRRDFEKCEYWWNKADSVFPRRNHPNFWRTYDVPLAQVFQGKGRQAGSRNDIPAAIAYLEKAVKYDPMSSDIWTDLGGAYYTVKNYNKAYECWQKALQLNPNNAQAKQGMSAIQLVPSK
ncbi:MAG: tetratricopeptide repeat protein [Bacteroidota bacterium]